LLSHPQLDPSLLLPALRALLAFPPLLQPSDVRQSCLDFAAQHYSATTLLTTPQQSPTDIAQQLQLKLAAAAAAGAYTTVDTIPWASFKGLLLQGMQPDVVIDCVGVQQTLEAAVRAVAPGGKIVLVGMGSEQLQLPATLLTCKEVDLLGSFRCVILCCYIFQTIHYATAGRIIAVAVWREQQC
jgi:L-iditol 2-dehydrogenase